MFISKRSSIEGREITLGCLFALHRDRGPSDSRNRQIRDSLFRSSQDERYSFESLRIPADPAAEFTTFNASDADCAGLTQEQSPHGHA